MSAELPRFVEESKFPFTVNIACLPRDVDPLFLHDNPLAQSDVSQDRVDRSLGISEQLLVAHAEHINFRGSKEHLPLRIVSSDSAHEPYDLAAVVEWCDGALHVGYEAPPLLGDGVRDCLPQ